jgi:hypothetical protein
MSSPKASFAFRVIRAVRHTSVTIADQLFLAIFTGLDYIVVLTIIGSPRFIAIHAVLET